MKTVITGLLIPFIGTSAGAACVFLLKNNLKLGVQRQYDLRCEVETYLEDHPEAVVVNLGCGLDDTFSKVDNGRCQGYNLDMPDVIRVRNELLPAVDREKNIACDLNDFAWMDAIDTSGGASL